MKKILKYSWLLGLWLLTSCSNWLNVEPFDQVSEEQQYSKAEGFYNQLNGIYKSMASAELYGKELTWGFLDVLAQYYDMSGSTSTKNYGYINGAELDYENIKVKPYFDTFWESMYTAIANCNNLIQNTVVVDSNIFPMREMERRCIEGEARALRAMLHFDLLRMYAPAPRVDSTGKYLAYVDYFPTHIPLAISTNEYLDKVYKDLLDAHTLTMSYDTLYSNSISQNSYRLELSNLGALSSFWQNRGYRLHHYAIKGLLARVALYKEDKAEALKWASDVLDYYSWFQFNDKYDIVDDGNMKLYGDVIFALYNNNLTMYEEQENTTNSYLSLYDDETLFSDEERDIRRYQYAKDEREQISDNKNKIGGSIPIKYKKIDAGIRKAKACNAMIPMIRMSEMCYILAECYYEKEEKKAIQWLDYIRSSRGCRNASPSVGTQAKFNELILKDFRREFYGEGQLLL